MKGRGWALITGASSGLGAEFARQLAARGWNLVLTARRADRLRALAGELEQAHRIRTHVIVADLAAIEGPATLLRALRAQRLAIRLFINNAGFGYHGEIADQPADDQDAMIAVNVRAMALLARAIARPMRKTRRGAIVNLASVAGFQPCPFVGTYGATKAFVLSFSEALAEELRPHGVRVIAVCPGVTESEFHAKAGPPYRMHRWAHPVPADVCVRRCLAALDAGHVVHVDGGKNRVLLTLQRFVPRAIIRRVGRFLLTPMPGGDGHR